MKIAVLGQGKYIHLVCINLFSKANVKAYRMNDDKENTGNCFPVYMAAFNTPLLCASSNSEQMWEKASYQ